MRHPKNQQMPDPQFCFFRFQPSGISLRIAEPPSLFGHFPPSTGRTGSCPQRLAGEEDAGLRMCMQHSGSSKRDRARTLTAAGVETRCQTTRTRWGCGDWGAGEIRGQSDAYCGRILRSTYMEYICTVQYMVRSVGSWVHMWPKQGRRGWHRNTIYLLCFPALTEA